ncbi:MAG: hypothetical protein JNK63_08080 [Chthonomonas sp.]|nr:hypothetical protein [Chthonomonas sp.]
MSIELSYDKENRLIQHHDVDAALITDFSYDPFSHKKLESNNDIGTKELFWLDDLYLGEGAAGVFDKAYIQADGYLVGEVEDVQGQQNTNYYIVDYLGSVVGENDETGSVWNERRYTPYGGLLSGDDFVPFAPNWVGAYSYRYNGLTYATQYMWHRHWSGESKQWITRDPIWPSELPYAYVDGNPTSWSDPTGLQCAPPGKDCCTNSLEKAKGKCQNGVWGACPDKGGLDKKCNAISNLPEGRKRIECNKLYSSLYAAGKRCSNMCLKGAGGTPGFWDAMSICCKKEDDTYEHCGIYCCSSALPKANSSAADHCSMSCLLTHEKLHELQCVASKGATPLEGECCAYYFQTLCLLQSYYKNGCHAFKPPPSSLKECYSKAAKFSCSRGFLPVPLPRLL